MPDTHRHHGDPFNLEYEQWVRESTGGPADREYRVEHGGEVAWFDTMAFENRGGTPTEVLVDAKGRYAQFLDPDTGGWKPWWQNSEKGLGSMNKTAERQRLHEQNPLHVSAVIGEAALSCMVGDADVTVGQCDRLLMLMELFNIDIRLLPLSSPLHSAFAQPFTMLDYAKPDGDPGIVYLEHLSRSQFLDEDHEISQYRTAFDRLQDAAYDDSMTRHHIEALRQMAKL